MRSRPTASRLPCAHPTLTAALASLRPECLTAPRLAASQVRDSWLRAGGVLAVNLIAFVDGPHVDLAVNVVRTLRSVFTYVQVVLS